MRPPSPWNEAGSTSSRRLSSAPVVQSVVLTAADPDGLVETTISTMYLPGRAASG